MSRQDERRVANQTRKVRTDGIARIRADKERAEADPQAAAAAREEAGPAVIAWQPSPPDRGLPTSQPATEEILMLSIWPRPMGPIR